MNYNILRRDLGAVVLPADGGYTRRGETYQGCGHTVLWHRMIAGRLGTGYLYLYSRPPPALLIQLPVLRPSGRATGANIDRDLKRGISVGVPATDEQPVGSCAKRGRACDRYSMLGRKGKPIATTQPRILVMQAHIVNNSRSSGLSFTNALVMHKVWVSRSRRSKSGAGWPHAPCRAIDDRHNLEHLDYAPRIPTDPVDRALCEDPG
jgi:hypothetical protein